ncbi:aspartate/glutamate racemase family protein [Pelomonas sp. KK5]|uniref:aspartate/glutamate racemase family protein n=1 Tax=Pelomonas sp. KK5 TaxID=1855730 RepID=UPI00097BF92C|nr:amino acid racemase [Pelomonas sp. KK5]
MPAGRSIANGPSTGGLVGVLGGMGPLATIDFMRKMLAHTPAAIDQDHVPVVVASVPQIPDRTAAFQGRGPSPLQALVESGRRLIEAGVDVIVMPCNTAHLWFDELQSELVVPMLHIVDAAIRQIPTEASTATRVGLLATEATLGSGLYAARTASARLTIDWLSPTPDEMRTLVTPAIAAVKAGRIEEARQALRLAARSLAARGAQAVVMGCTEIPLALDEEAAGCVLVDATDALARAAVAWSRRTELQ